MMIQSVAKNWELYSEIYQFFKENIDLLLKVIVSSDSQMNDQELDALRIILYVENPDTDEKVSISSLSPFFKEYSDKEDMENIEKWLMKMVSEEQSASWEDLDPMSKCVTIRDQEQALGKNI